MVRKIILFSAAIIIFSKTASYSQQDYYPFEIEKYSFIRYDKNYFIFFNDSSKFENIFDIYDSLIIYGKGQLKIVHIGGSHIQADVYTNRIRRRLQTFYPGLTGARGFIFPYRIAKTNNPSNFQVKYSGLWYYCKNTQQKINCTLGLSGYSISTYNPNSSIQIIINTDSSTNYDFNKVKIFHNHDTTNFKILINNDETIHTARINDTLGYTEFEFRRHQEELNLSFFKADSIQNHFTIYGMSLENNDPGIIYNSVGVNGAKLSSYLRCSLFTQHLAALEPDLIIISLGTNDGYSRSFSGIEYREQYEQLLKLIRQTLPEAAILLTVPNDSYLFRKYINRNTEKMRSIIFDLARNNNFGVWDFYTIMGGLNSSYVWNLNGLMNRDKIHFNRRGYLFKGDLFFNAFLKAYENHINCKLQTESRIY
jgi:lysophospholipase L1-like esterase